MYNFGPPTWTEEFFGKKADAGEKTLGSFFPKIFTVFGSMLAVFMVFNGFQ